MPQNRMAHLEPQFIDWSVEGVKKYHNEMSRYNAVMDSIDAENRAYQNAMAGQPSNEATPAVHAQVQNAMGQSAPRRGVPANPQTMTAGSLSNFRLNPDIKNRSAIWPRSHNYRTGEAEWAVPQMGISMAESAMLPGDVLHHNAPVTPSRTLQANLDYMLGAGAFSGAAPRGAVLGANVWQGGPNKYGPGGAADSLKHMNKGEGAQAYGWGRYDADAPAVAKDYQRKLGLSDNVKPDERAIRDHAAKFEELNKALAVEDGKLLDALYGRKAASVADGEATAKRSSALTAEREALHKRMVDETKERIGDGYLYKHDLPDEDIARYLDWDAPLSKQTQAVQDIAKQYGIKTTPSGMKEARGSDIYRAIGHAEQKPPFDTGSMNPGSREGSEALGRAGIPGLKYYDGMSRGKYHIQLKHKGKDYGDPMTVHAKNQVDDILKEYREKGFEAEVKDLGTRNYVTWDQDVLNRMKLLERNGENMIFKGERNGENMIFKDERNGQNMIFKGE